MFKSCPHSFPSADAVRLVCDVSISSADCSQLVVDDLGYGGSNGFSPLGLVEIRDPVDSGEDEEAEWEEGK